MCTTCGCDQDHEHDPAHGHLHQHTHDDDHDNGRLVRLEIDVLAKSRRLAEENRAWLRHRGIFMLNLMSSPGAGKTTLLERTAAALGAATPLFVIEGDQATSIDSDRIRAAGARSVQVNTGTGCHLDPHMIRHALEEMDPPPRSCVVVENVGNLVCPALFDLGEQERVVVLSTPEGDDKPLKYPHMFQAATLVLLNKIDLLPYVPFDVSRFERAVRSTSANAGVLQLAALGGVGIEAWCGWLRDQATRAPERHAAHAEGALR